MRDIALDSTATQLCQPLVAYLRARPTLDDVDKKCLAEAMTEIQNCLVMERTGTKTGTIKGTSDESLSSNQTRKVMVVSSTSQTSAGPKSPQKTNKHRRKLRSIIATQPYLELDEEVSNVTVMEWLFGRCFFEWWWSWRKFIWPLLWVTSSVTSALCAATLMLEDKRTATITGIVNLPLFCLTFLHNASLANAFLFLRSVRGFEARLFLLEGILFSISVAGVFGFTLDGWVSGLHIVLFLIAQALWYDALPKAARRKQKVVVLVNSLLLWTLGLALFYLGLPPRMGRYRWDPLQGLHNEDNVLVKSKWTVSLVDACLNRGLTILCMQLRATYLAFRHPEDCIFLRSRLRVVELENPR